MLIQTVINPSNNNFNSILQSKARINFRKGLVYLLVVVSLSVPSSTEKRTFNWSLRANHRSGPNIARIQELWTWVRIRMVSCQGNTAPGEGLGWSKHLPCSDLWGIILTASRWGPLKTRARGRTRRKSRVKTRASVQWEEWNLFIIGRKRWFHGVVWLMSSPPSCQSVFVCWKENKARGAERERESERGREGGERKGWWGVFG